MHHSYETKIFRAVLFPWAICATLFTSFYRLGDVPKFFYDEGFFSQIAQNLANNGIYASKFDQNWVPVEFSVGPFFLAPASLMMRLFGSGIFQSRLWPAICAVLLFYGTFRLLRRFSGVLTSLLFAVVLFHVYLLHFLAVYGESTALIWLLSGLLLFPVGIQEPVGNRSLLCGFCFGAMLASKASFLVILVSFIVAVFTNPALRKTALSIRGFQWCCGFIIPILMWLLLGAFSTGAWNFIHYNIEWLGLGTRVSVLGWESNMQLVSLRSWSYRAAQAFTVITTVAITKRVGILSSGQFAFLWVLVCQWFFSGIWFLFFSAGWIRYGLAFESLTCWILGITATSVMVWITAVTGLQSRIWKIFPVAIVVLLPLRSVMSKLHHDGANDDLVMMARYIDAAVSPSEKIETYEWTIDILSRGKFRHPSADEHVERMRCLRVGREPLPIDFWKQKVDFLLTGPFSNTMRGYPKEMLKLCGEVLETYGEYQLYRVADRDCFDQYFLEQLRLRDFTLPDKNGTNFVCLTRPCCDPKS